MKAKWERMISANMESVQIPGRDAPVFKPKDGGFVWVVVGNGEVLTPPPNMQRQDMAPRGCRELDLDVSDPDFLVLYKTIGMTQYTHCIPWAAITDIIFVNMSAA